MGGCFISHHTTHTLRIRPADVIVLIRGRDLDGEIPQRRQPSVPTSAHRRRRRRRRLPLRGAGVPGPGRLQRLAQVDGAVEPAADGRFDYLQDFFHGRIGGEGQPVRSEGLGSGAGWEHGFFFFWEVGVEGWRGRELVEERGGRGCGGVGSRWLR